MEPAPERDITIHFLSAYVDNDSGGRDVEYPRTLGEQVVLTVGRYNSLRHSVKEALLADESGTVPEIVRTRVEADMFWLNLWRDADPWHESEDEEFLLYSLDYDGALRIHQWGNDDSLSLQGVEESVAAGYLHGDSAHFVLHTHEGRGGDYGVFDLAGWLYAQGVDIGVPLLRDGFIWWVLGRTVWRPFTKLVGRIRNGRADRRARAVAWGWANRNIETPYQLHNFIDTKNDWTINEVNTRLFDGQNSVASRQLLEALGLEPDARNVWQVGSSRKAIKRRAKWIDAERRQGIV